MNDALDKTPKHIQKRSEAKGIYHAIEATKEQKMIFFNHLNSIGATNSVLGNNKEINRQIMHKWFTTLVVSNPRFPSDLPVHFVMDEFFNAILHQKTVLKGHNLNAHMQAFHQWIDKYEQELRQRYWIKQNPNRRPIALPENASVDEEKEKITDRQRAENLRKIYGGNPPESIQKLIKRLEG